MRHIRPITTAVARRLILALACMSCSGDAGREPARALHVADARIRAAAEPQLQALPRNLGADSALAAIRTFGPRRVIDSLYLRDGAAYTRWFQEFGRGDSLWLEVARALAPGLDGETGETMVETLRDETLLVAPRLVLRLVADSSSYGPPSQSELCSPVVSTRGQAAMESVEDPELRAVRDACLADIRRGR